MESSLLRQIADLPRGESIAEDDLTFERRYESEQGFDQCRLTGAVLADDAQIVTAVKAEVDIRSDCMPFIAERETAAGKLRRRRQQLSGRLRTLLGLRLERILRGSGAIQIGCLCLRLQGMCRCLRLFLCVLFGLFLQHISFTVLSVASSAGARGRRNSVP